MNFEMTFSNQKDALLLKNEVPPGISLTVPDIIIRKDFGTDIAVSIVIGVATGIPSSLVAAWLYDKLKHHRSRQICINRREVHISEGEITKVIEETTKISE
jgi:H+/gluconate symporter-like permease